MDKLLLQTSNDIRIGLNPSSSSWSWIITWLALSSRNNRNPPGMQLCGGELLVEVERGSGFGRDARCEHCGESVTDLTAKCVVLYY